jgi:class 3 adenylate cyclase
MSQHRPSERMHWSEVLHANGDYSGRGVHEAARIAPLAGGRDIRTTTTTMATAGKHYQHGPTRWVELRGLPGQVEVVPLNVIAS